MSRKIQTRILRFRWQWIDLVETASSAVGNSAKISRRYPAMLNYF